MKKHGQLPMGSICWAEYHSTDANKSKSFYTDLLNWKIREVKSGDYAYYFFQANDQDICGMFNVGSDWSNAPYWNPYIAVEDVDAVASKVEQLGGKLRIPPMDVPEGGRIACIEDPSGGVFSIFSPGPSAE